MTEHGSGDFNWFRNTAPYINAHRGKRFVLMIGGEVANEGRTSVITGAHDMVYNDLENKDRVDTTTRTVSLDDGTVRIPSTSATMLKVPLR